MNGGQYNDVLANDTYMVDVLGIALYMIFGKWSLGKFAQSQFYPIFYFKSKNFTKTHNDVINSIMVTSPMYFRQLLLKF
jgi:hypothetical protein